MSPRWTSIAVAAAILGLAAAPALARTTGPERSAAAVVPQSMVGKWSRYVPLKAFEHYKVSDPKSGVGTWKVTIKRTGLIDIFRPKATTATLEGTIRVTPARAVFKVGCDNSNHYTWKVSSAGKLLRFVYGSDSGCPQRAAVMSGYWKKRS